jgi:hypothetical protein
MKIATKLSVSAPSVSLPALISYLIERLEAMRPASWRRVGNWNVERVASGRYHADFAPEAMELERFAERLAPRILAGLEGSVATREEALAILKEAAIYEASGCAAAVPADKLERFVEVADPANERAKEELAERLAFGSVETPDLRQYADGTGDEEERAIFAKAIAIRERIEASYGGPVFALPYVAWFKSAKEAVRSGRIVRPYWSGPDLDTEEALRTWFVAALNRRIATKAGEAPRGRKDSDEWRASAMADRRDIERALFGRVRCTFLRTKELRERYLPTLLERFAD